MASINIPHRHAPSRRAADDGTIGLNPFALAEASGASASIIQLAPTATRQGLVYHAPFASALVVGRHRHERASAVISVLQREDSNSWPGQVYGYSIRKEQRLLANPHLKSSLGFMDATSLQDAAHRSPPRPSAPTQGDTESKSHRRHPILPAYALPGIEIPGVGVEGIWEGYATGAAPYSSPVQPRIQSL